METTDNRKPESGSDEHAAIKLPEQMDRSNVGTGRTPQSTAGTKTPSPHKRRDMSEAAERKARRDEPQQDKK